MTITITSNIEERLREYYKKTAPLTGFYHAKKLLKGVDGMESMEEVTQAIETILKSV